MVPEVEPEAVAANYWAPISVVDFLDKECTEEEPAAVQDRPAVVVLWQRSCYHHQVRMTMVPTNSLH